MRYKSKKQREKILARFNEMLKEDFDDTEIFNQFIKIFRHTTIHKLGERYPEELMEEIRQAGEDACIHDKEKLSSRIFNLYHDMTTCGCALDTLRHFIESKQYSDKVVELEVFNSIHKATGLHFLKDRKASVKAILECLQNSKRTYLLAKLKKLFGTLS